MTSRVSLFALSAAVLALAACSQAEEPASAPATPAAETPAEAPAAAAPALALDGDGFRLVDPDSGSTRLLAFGAPIDQAVTALTAARGAPTEQGQNPECGAGPLDFANFGDGLTVWSQDGLFVGWAVNQAGLSTMNGIAVGATRAQLEGSGTEVSVQQTTLGTEFAAGEIYGLLDGPQGAVANLWAGISCNFR